MDIVPGAQGVWVGWQRGNTTGVLRAEIGIDKAGNHFIQTLPMTLPVMTPPPFQGVDRRIKIHSTLQSMSFIFQPFPQGKDETIAEKVAAILVYEDHARFPAATLNSPPCGNGQYTAPHSTNTVVSPIGTTIQTLQPLHAIPPYSLALAIISSSDGRTRSRVHLDLSAKQWNPKGHYPIKGIRGDVTTLVVSQGAERGQLGLCAVVDQYRSQQLGVVKKLDELALLIVQRIYNLAANEIDMDQLFLVSRVQIALFSVFKNDDDDDDDARLALATDILRLNEASELVDRCAIFEDDGSIAFDLDPCSPLLILLHPTLRSLCLRILSQLHQLSTFLSTLDRPILQPENKVLPASNTRDPMATVVAREQIRDIPLRQGVDVEQWGRALESFTMSPAPDQTDIDQSLIQLSITPLCPHLPALLKILHTSSTLFTSEYFQNQNQNQNQRVMYDAIDWSILHDRGGGGGDENKEVVVVCDRCGWQTEALTKSATTTTTTTTTTTISPWAEWKSQAEENCICGGTWVRKQVEMED
ncbi:hypothetical protein I309_02598 [Cryptococcus deuterogattii LA55]|nr:hypothetical protein I309_02598 [Cryptococcus deuterogattii LA55]KIR93690.1 hypothetical protein I304_02364 [Cryptococcus deuterogattii CBS 10090]